MNNYIILDGRKYMTISGQWAPSTARATQIRPLLSGRDDVTFGPAPRKYWDGTIVAPITPVDASWGSVGDMRTSMNKMSVLAFSDHFGVGVSVVLVNPNNEVSYVPDWEQPDNEIKFSVQLTQVNL